MTRLLYESERNPELPAVEQSQIKKIKGGLVQRFLLRGRKALHGKSSSQSQPKASALPRRTFCCHPPLHR